MVDGDNIQIKLGIDDFINTWANGAFQTINLNLRTGSSQLSDAVQVLRLLVGVPLSPDTFRCFQDVDADGKIGLPEAIYIMQSVAGLR